MKCHMCKKEIPEHDLFWYLEIEKISPLLESKIVWVKICAEHYERGYVEYANLLKKRYNGEIVIIEN